MVSKQTFLRRMGGIWIQDLNISGYSREHKKSSLTIRNERRSLRGLIPALNYTQ